LTFLAGRKKRKPSTSIAFPRSCVRGKKKAGCGQPELFAKGKKGEKKHLHVVFVKRKKKKRGGEKSMTSLQLRKGEKKKVGGYFDLLRDKKSNRGGGGKKREYVLSAKKREGEEEGGGLNPNCSQEKKTKKREGEGKQSTSLFWKEGGGEFSVRW